MNSLKLRTPDRDAEFLRRVFEMARDGIRDELANYPDQLREPARLHREEAVYDRLLAALDGDPLSLDRDVRIVVGDLTQTIDRENEYARVVAEHSALVGLLGEVEGRRK